MSRNYVFIRLFIPLFIAVFLCSCGENASGSSEAVNLFEYALEIGDGVLVPKEVDFFMSVGEVLQATGLNEDAVSEKDEDGNRQITAYVNIAGFPEDVMVIYGFSGVDDRLYTVQYAFKVDEAEAADIHNLLYEQATSTMPEASGNTIEGIKDGVDVFWEDKEQNYVRLYFSTLPGSADHSETVSLMLQAARNVGIKSLF